MILATFSLVTTYAFSLLPIGDYTRNLILRSDILQNTYPESQRHSPYTHAQAPDIISISSSFVWKIGGSSRIFLFTLPAFASFLEIYTETDCNLANANVELSEGDGDSLYRFYVSDNYVNRVYVPLIGALKRAERVTIRQIQPCNVMLSTGIGDINEVSYFIQPLGYDDRSVLWSENSEKDSIGSKETHFFSFRGFIGEKDLSHVVAPSSIISSNLQLGSKLIGFAAQGRFSRDFIQVPLPASLEFRTIRLQGINRRGVLAFGWQSTIKELPPLKRDFTHGNFLLHGSSFRISDPLIDECILVPPLDNQAFLFLSTITDAFSNSYHDFETKAEIYKGNLCTIPQRTKAFIPSL